jgi:hypothetical protein
MSRPDTVQRRPVQAVHARTSMAIILAFFCSVCLVTGMLHQVVISLFLLAGMTFVYAIAIRHTEVPQEKPPKAPRRDNTERRF